jgi:hypothetical protein
MMRRWRQAEQSAPELHANIVRATEQAITRAQRERSLAGAAVKQARLGRKTDPD